MPEALSTWLEHPAMQSGILPFLVSLIFALLLWRTRYFALALLAGFLTTVTLTIGLSFAWQNWGASQKLAWALITALPVMLMLDRQPRPWRVALITLALATTAPLWMAWRVLTQLETIAFLLAAAGAVMYTTALTLSSLRLQKTPVASTSVHMVMGLSTGVLALLAGSASLAFFGLALGASAAAVLLCQLIRGSSIPSAALCVFPALASALIGINAVLTGSLPWHNLIPVALMPCIALWSSTDSSNHSPLRQVFTVLVKITPLALLSIALAWFRAGGA